ncbi:MAG: imidazolonepropionase [Saprospiraceae bacterium]|jgi:imidazolonepropionase
MPSILLRNIKSLVQVRETNSPLRGLAMQDLKTLENAWLLIDNEQIKDFGAMKTCPENADQIIDTTGKMVLPSWCDSHTHLVYAGSREGEFVDRINGLSYVEIARRGGGILNSASRLQHTSEAELFEHASIRLEEVKNYGTGAIEIKSGYGLNTAAELKMLRVIRRLKESSDLTIKATFLGAHAIPQEYKADRNAYIDLIIKEMLPRIAGEGLADYIDVFCEKVAFSVAETAQIMEAGAKYGLKPKIHTNQFNCMGGIQASVKHGAISVDHLEVINDEEIACLLKSDTIATLLPSAPFFINDHYPPARKMLDAGIAIALATDFNPGSTPSGRMPFVLSLACIKMRMSPEEAINAATINGAYAMELGASHGSITKGKAANLFITKPIPSLAYLPYSFGSDLVEEVILQGKRV